MNDLDDLEPNGEPLDEAGSLMLQLVAAVDYMRRGISRPSPSGPPSNKPCAGTPTSCRLDRPRPAATSLRLSFSSTAPGSAADTFNAAIRRWVEAAAAAYNDSIPWDPSFAPR